MSAQNEVEDFVESYMEMEAAKHLQQIELRTSWSTEFGACQSLCGLPLPQTDVPQLLSDDLIWMAFMPRFFRYDDSIFGCLNYSDLQLSNICLKRYGGDFWSLDESLQERWKKLEDGLCDMCVAMLKTRPDLDTIPFLRAPNTPYSQGYRRAHAKRQYAIKCAIQSRDAFKYLIAFTSFCMASLMFPGGPAESFYTRLNIVWMVLTDPKRVKTPLSERTISILEKSVVCDHRTYPRVGCLIDAKLTSWRHHLFRFVYFDVPIWLVWGPGDTQPQDPGLLDWKPSSDEVQLARRHFLEQQERVSEVMASPHPSQPTTSTQTIHMPVPFEGSGQRVGENWEQFFARMEEGRLRKIEKEDARGKASREAREALAAKDILSKSKPPTVFEWKFVEGHWMRKKIYLSDARRSFGSYHPWQKKYWFHVHQWDMMEMLPPPSDYVPPSDILDAAQPDWENDDYGLDDRRWVEKDAVAANKCFFESLEAVANEPCVGARACDDAISPEEEQVDGILKDIELMATPPPNLVQVFESNTHLRFGFRRNDLPSSNVLESAHIAVKSPGPKLIQSLFLHKDANTQSNWPEHLYQILINPRLAYYNLPRCFDVSRSSNNRLSISQANFTIRKVRDSPYYLVSPPGPVRLDDQWHLAIEDPATVLQVLRQTFITDMDSLARSLLEAGVTMQMVIPKVTEYRPLYSMKISTRVGLGNRPPNHKYNKEDFDAYVLDKVEILQTSYGRSLRLRGGLIGRIAKEYVSVDDVLQGPCRLDFKLFHHNGYDYYTDGVTREMAETVLGVYCVLTIEDDTQPAHFSWWPTEAIWMSSGAYLGFWAPDNEAFYRRRVEELEQGTFSVFPKNTWRRRLKWGGPKTRTIFDRNAKISMDFLDSHLPSH